MPRVAFSNFSVDLPPGWSDTTANVKADDPPATVTRDDSVGALQFTIALYKSGPRPSGDIEEVQELLNGFAQSRGWLVRKEKTREISPRGLVAASFRPEKDFVRVWYISESGNVAFVTYLCAANRISRPELAEAEQIVRSLKFGSTTAMARKR